MGGLKNTKRWQVAPPFFSFTGGGVSHRELCSDIRDGPLYCISKPATWCWYSQEIDSHLPRKDRTAWHSDCRSPAFISLCPSLSLSFSLPYFLFLSIAVILSLFHLSSLSSNLSLSLSRSLCLSTVDPEPVVYKTRLAVACTLQRQTS